MRARDSGESMAQNNVYQHWLSGYYTHSPDTLNSFSSLSLDQFRAGLVVGPALGLSDDDYRPSTARMTPQEYAEITDPSVTTRAHPLFHAVHPGIYWDNVQAALWDSTTWPHLRLTIVWCDMSPPETVISAWYLSKKVKEDWPEGARKVDVVRFQGVNHFVSDSYPPVGSGALAHGQCRTLGTLGPSRANDGASRRSRVIERATRRHSTVWSSRRRGHSACRGSSMYRVTVPTYSPVPIIFLKDRQSQTALPAICYVVTNCMGCQSHSPNSNPRSESSKHRTRPAARTILCVLLGAS